MARLPHRRQEEPGPPSSKHTERKIQLETNFPEQLFTGVSFRPWKSAFQRLSNHGRGLGRHT